MAEDETMLDVEPPTSPLSPAPSNLSEPAPIESTNKVEPSSPPPVELVESVVPVEPVVERFTRERKAPERYVEQLTEPLTTERKLTPKRKLQPIRGNWSSEHLLTRPSSKLTNINLMDLLSSPRAWTELSQEQQVKLISMLPNGCTSNPATTPADDEGNYPHIVHNHLRGNSSFAADVRLFQEDLKIGRYDPVWLRDAKAAMEKRASGAFDDWKEKNREEFWGQKQKMQYDVVAGESSQHTLPNLVEGSMVEVGDIWLFRRAKGQGKASIVVEKEAKVEKIHENHLLTFSFPPGQHKYSAPSNGEDKTIEGVDGPTMLSEALLTEDDRIAGMRAANAWKDFRCNRKNQDMGSLWELRELYHQRVSLMNGMSKGMTTS